MIRIIVSVVLTIALNLFLSYLVSKGTFDFFTDYERKTRKRRSKRK